MADNLTDPARIDQRRRLAQSLRPVVVGGTAVIAGFIGIFGTWASVTPLASAALAPGVISPDSSRKTVQHLEGGIVAEVLVKDGDIVVSGQPLIRLDTALAQANWSSRREQVLRLKISKARLEAHLANGKSIRLPAELPKKPDAALTEFIKTQQDQFTARNQMVVERELILNQQILQLRDEIKSKEFENQGLDEQLKLIDAEVSSKKKLIAQKLVREPDYFAVLRSAAATRARIGSNNADISKARQKIEEVRLQINAGRTQFQDQNTADLTKTNADIAQMEEAMAATGDILKRTEVLAPVHGTVLNLRTRTIGGVVRPGDAIVDIVPKDDELIIDARLQPVDVSSVIKGMTALVQLSGFTARHTPLLPAVVTEVSADALTDQQTQQRYFTVRVSIPKTEVEKAEATGVKLLTGMQAEVFVVTGQSTPLRYAFDPVVKSFRRAFIEK